MPRGTPHDPGEPSVNNGTPSTRTAGLALTLVLALAACAPEPDPQAQITERLWQIQDHQAQGKHHAAVIELKNLLADAPRNPRARWLLGQSYLELGDGAAAEKELRTAQELGVNRETLLRPLAEALLAQGKARALVDEIRAPSEMGAGARARIHALRGAALLETGDRAAAAMEFTRALELDAGTSLALLGRAHLALGDGRLASARSFIGQALEHAESSRDQARAWSLMAEIESRADNPAEVEQATTQAMALSEQDEALRLRRALARIDKGDLAGAHEDLQVLARAAPKDPRVLHARGLLALRQERFAEARDLLERLYGMQPENQQAAFLLGVAHFALGDMQRAELMLAPSAQALVPDPNLLRLLAQARLRLGRTDAAAKAVGPLLAVQPDVPEVMSLAASIYLAQGRDAEARALLEQVLALRPEAAAERLQLGLALLRTGEKQRGLEEMGRATGNFTDTRHGEVVLLLGYLQAGAFDEAAGVAQRMHAETPDSPDPWNATGLIQEMQGELDSAADAFARALALRPGDPGIGSNLARVELRRGREASARTVYRGVLEHHPEHLDTLMTLARLEARGGDATAAGTLVRRAHQAHPAALAPRLWLAQQRLEAGEPTRALTLLREAETLYPANPILLRALGIAQLAAGDTANAAGTLARAASLNPGQPGIHLLAGQACAQADDAACLAQALENALARDGEAPGAGALARHLLTLLPAERAGETLERLHGIAPTHPAIADLRGQRALQQGRARDAVAIYRSMRTQDPERWLWTGRLAEALRATGSLGESSDLLASWLKTHPQEYQARHMLAENLMAAGRDERALALFEAVLKQEPDLITALNNIAWLLRNRNPQRALPYAERAVALAPGFATRDTLGVILLNLGDETRGMELLRQAFNEQPDAPEVGYHLAMAMAAGERRDEARELLREVLGSGAAFSERREAEALLRRLEAN